MSKRVIHLITTISTMLAVVDDEGDVTQRIPIQGEIAKLNATEFGLALQQIQEERRKVEEGLAQAQETAPGTAGTALKELINADSDTSS